LCLAAVLLPVSVHAQIAGGALSCDGFDDFARVPDAHGDFDLGAAMTLEAWVRHDSFKEFSGYVGGFSGSFALYQYTGAKPGIAVSVPATDSALGANAISLGVWTHIAGTFDGSTLKVYVNGVLAGTKAHSGSATSASELRICRFPNANGPFLHGAVDEVRVWEVVRSGAEIAASFNRKLSGMEPGLVAYYRFDEGSGQTLIDSSGNGNDGYLGSSATPFPDDPARIVSGAPLTGVGACVRDARTACLLGGRFEVKVSMWNFANPPVLFPGMIQTYGGQSSETDQSVSFYSFQAGNVEVFVKMVNACANGAFHSYWLFAAGATNAETEILVRDTVAEETVRIFNPRSILFETVADTRAFETCDSF
jgi:hypothetical protein